MTIITSSFHGFSFFSAGLQHDLTSIFCFFQCDICGTCLRHFQHGKHLEFAHAHGYRLRKNLVPVPLLCVGYYNYRHGILFFHVLVSNSGIFQVLKIDTFGKKDLRTVSIEWKWEWVSRSEWNPFRGFICSPEHNTIKMNRRSLQMLFKFLKVLPVRVVHQEGNPSRAYVRMVESECPEQWLHWMIGWYQPTFWAGWTALLHLSQKWHWRKSSWHCKLWILFCEMIAQVLQIIVARRYDPFPTVQNFELNLPNGSCHNKKYPVVDCPFMEKSFRSIYCTSIIMIPVQWISIFPAYIVLY